MFFTVVALFTFYSKHSSVANSKTPTSSLQQNPVCVNLHHQETLANLFSQLCQNEFSSICANCGPRYISMDTDKQSKW